MPVRHVRLVNCPQLPSRLFAQRVEVRGKEAVRTTILKPGEPLKADDRVVLIKPFGCFEDSDNIC